MSKLTVKELEALSTKDHGKKLREDGGLIGSVRCGTSGVSVYFDWRYRFDGKVKQIAVGAWPKLSLASIRTERDRLKVEVDDGSDPTERRKAERLKVKVDQLEEIEKQQKRLDEIVAHQTRLTVRGLFEHWNEVDLVRRKDGGKEVRRMFEKDVLPKLGTLPVTDVKKGHITLVTDPLLARGVNRMAKVVFSLVRQMFRFAVDRDYIEADPTASIRKVKIGGTDTERERVLSRAEIQTLFHQLPTARLMPQTEAAVWIVLATLCRIGELSSAKWSDIDLDNRRWRIPETKNGKPHEIYLSDFAVEYFRKVKALSNPNIAWVYPGRDHKKALSSKSITKQLGDRQRSSEPMKRRSKSTSALALPGGKWGPHDLRRTGATMMTQLHVLPDVVEHCLNHIEENRTKRVYQRHTYEHEMQVAWKALGKHLTRLATLHVNNMADSAAKTPPPTKKSPGVRKNAVPGTETLRRLRTPSLENAPRAQIS